MLRIQHVTPLTGYNVELTLTDGTTIRRDLLPYLRGPVFDRIREDASFFRQVRVDGDLGTVVWPNGADLDPDVLIHGRRPASWADVAVAREPGPEGGSSES